MNQQQKLEPTFAKAPPSAEATAGKTAGRAALASVIPMGAGQSALCSAWEDERANHRESWRRRVLGSFASIGRAEAGLSKAQDDPMDRPRQFGKALLRQRLRRAGAPLV